MAVLAIDLGDKRCGIATETNGIAFAADIVARHELISILKKYLSQGSYDTIVVGLPYDLHGKKDTQLNKTKKFIDKLKNIFPQQEIIGIDERFTSFSADMTLREMGQDKNIGQKDALAAAEILQNFIDSKK